jgi:hypothetical protein
LRTRASARPVCSDREAARDCALMTYAYAGRRGSKPRASGLGFRARQADVGASHAKASSPRGRAGGRHVCVGSAEPGPRTERAGGRHRYRSARRLAAIDHDARHAAFIRRNDTRAGRFTGSSSGDGAGCFARADGSGACASRIACTGCCCSCTSGIAGTDHRDAVGYHAAEGCGRRTIKGQEEKDQDDPAAGDRAFAQDRDGALALSQLGAEGISKIHSIREIAFHPRRRRAPVSR